MQTPVHAKRQQKIELKALVGIRRDVGEGLFNEPASPYLMSRAHQHADPRGAPRMRTSIRKGEKRTVLDLT